MTTHSQITKTAECSNCKSGCSPCQSQTGFLSPSDTAIRMLSPVTLAKDGFEVANLQALTGEEFQKVQQQEYASCKPGENTQNKLARKTRWGAYSCDAFTWHDRGTYSLPADLNPEEAGAIRRFEQLDEAFLRHPVTEELFRSVFHNWGFEKSSYEQLYQVQLSAIRYEPTIEAPAWPSPVAPHQDMVDGAIAVLHRTENIVGGLSRIYDLDKRPLVQMDLRMGDILFVRDAEVLHQVTPLMLEPGENWSAGKHAYRDVLLIRFQPVGR
ncbi:2OG-Fe dioxygenase family protein [Phaeobacter gallaeciensis]|uniref:2OG-Fe dioxygenase family protein n=1 Tax=Phaeobacter gallaeciensis TaxID=60890 RepID=A0ABD4XEA2_9RHOB|nr:2OG-Fe dioxygenase family protein [Phaeobacter gallaeciensis]MDE4142141.1 2OG-Fe dioxygenase family protein [Phaeobacter gallaeciensis]MDE4146545.1 2OG-Fe dioxygenase family protein [Phaeobacter gallaeciensis]MDE4150618.1 2OG-Fe dioxygenase family protein [Phaeobacter gallaeciensis]MDE4154915.1 2OG-Fe dioxygenase family protein [Phaeobacter gallaeciensis]MDE4159314.1 2OG-Fe dioxygenase family protein [Phaeobacter gallaeciensis]